MDHNITDKALRDAALMVDCKVKTRQHIDGYKFYAVVTPGDGEYLAYTSHEVVGLIDVFAGSHPRINGFMEAVGN